MKKLIAGLLTFTMLFTMLTSFSIVTTNAKSSLDEEGEKITDEKVEIVVWTQDFEKNHEGDDLARWTTDSTGNKPYSEGYRFNTASSGKGELKDEDNNYLLWRKSNSQVNSNQQAAVKVFLDQNYFEIGKEYRVTADICLVNVVGDANASRSFEAFVLKGVGSTTTCGGTEIVLKKDESAEISTAVFEYTDDLEAIDGGLNLRINPDPNLCGEDKYTIDNVKIVEVSTVGDTMDTWFEGIYDAENWETDSSDIFTVDEDEDKIEIAASTGAEELSYTFNGLQDSSMMISYKAEDTQEAVALSEETGNLPYISIRNSDQEIAISKLDATNIVDGKLIFNVPSDEENPGLFTDLTINIVAGNKAVVIEEISFTSVSSEMHEIETESTADKKIEVVADFKDLEMPETEFTAVALPEGTTVADFTKEDINDSNPSATLTGGSQMTFEIDMSEATLSGYKTTFSVILYNEENSLYLDAGEVEYINPNFAGEVLRYIKDAEKAYDGDEDNEDLDDVEDVIEYVDEENDIEYKVVLEFNTIEFLENATSEDLQIIYQHIFDNKDDIINEENENDLTLLHNVVKNAIPVAMVKNGYDVADFRQYVADNSDDLGVDESSLKFIEDDDTYSDELFGTFLDEIKEDETITTLDCIITQIFDKIIDYRIEKNKKNNGAIVEIIAEYSDYLGLDWDKVEKVSKKSYYGAVKNGIAKFVLKYGHEALTDDKIKSIISDAKESAFGGDSSGSSTTTSLPTNVTSTIKPVVNPSANFVDLHIVPWAEESIKTLASKGVVSGYQDGTFKPNNEITRAEFAKMLVTAFGVADTSAVTYNFIDVNTSDWYYSYVAKLANLGVTNGMGDGTFGANQKITRQDMVVLIVRMAQLLGKPINATAAEVTFNDNGNIASYASDAVKILQKAEIVSGFEDGTFRPDATATRAQVAKIICALIG